MDEINYQQFLFNNEAFAQQTLDAVYRLFDPAMSFDSFIFAWNQGQREFKAAVMFIAIRSYPSYFKNATPNTPAESFTDFQKKVLHRISKTLTEQGLKTCSVIDVTADYYQGMLDACQKPQAQREKVRGRNEC